MDYDDSPIARADTGIRKEYTHEEVEAMLERDEAYHTFLKQQKEMFTMLHKVLDELDREENEETVELTSIAREKILRGMRLSDEELDTTVFRETCRMMFGRITTKEFLRRMVIISGLTDLDSE